MSFGKYTGFYGKHHLIGVSILVLMDVVREGCRVCLSALGGVGVSILILMDVVREVQRNGPGNCRWWGFNPCSNGCRSGRQDGRLHGKYPQTVSILVLMDVVREVGVIDPPETPTRRFNPCSNGCRSGSFFEIHLYYC